MLIKLKKFQSLFFIYVLIGFSNILLTSLSFAVVYFFLNNYTIGLLLVFIQSFIFKKKLYKKFLIENRTKYNVKFFCYYIFLFFINFYTLKYFDNLADSNLIFIQILYMILMTFLNFSILLLVFIAKPPKKKFF